MNTVDTNFIKKIKCKHCKGTGFVKHGKKCPRCRGMGYWLKSLDENVYKICDCCHGTGIEHRSNYYFTSDKCCHCSGEGFFTWLDEILPKHKKKRKKSDRVNVTNHDYTYFVNATNDDYTYFIHNNFLSQAISEAAEKLKNKIDEEVIESIYKKMYNESLVKISWSSSFISLSDTLGVFNGRNIS